MSTVLQVEAPTPSLQRFIDSRRVEPWPLDQRFGYVGVRSSVLYEAYVAAMKADDRTVLPQVEWGATLNAAGFKSRHDDEGYKAYAGMFDRPREEVARALVIESIEWPERLRLRDEEDALHMATFDHGTKVVPVMSDDAEPKPLFYPDGVTPITREVPNACECDPQVLAEANREAIDAAVEAFVAAREEDGTVAKLVEERYGPYLRWREGDEDPRVAEWKALRDEYAAELARDDITWERRRELEGLIEVAESWLD